MTVIDFNNEPTKIVPISKLELLMNSVGMNWHGFKNLSVNDRDIFEEKTNISFEPAKDGHVKLHDLNYIYED